MEHQLVQTRFDQLHSGNQGNVCDSHKCSESVEVVEICSLLYKEVVEIHQVTSNYVKAY